MNEQQLEKISKYLNVKIGRNEAGEGYIEDEGPVEISPSIFGETEEVELKDNVEDLQNALHQDQGYQDDVLSRTSSKFSYTSSMHIKAGKSPLSQAGSSLTHLSQIQSLR